jgi:phosphoribosyl-ATP pyrophosphohydrolase
MKKLNTTPIENFLEKAKLAIKSNQKSLDLPIKEVADLQNSLAVVMTRLAGDLDDVVRKTQKKEKLEIKVDGGKF